MDEWEALEGSGVKPLAVFYFPSMHSETKRMYVWLDTLEWIMNGTYSIVQRFTMN